MDLMDILGGAMDSGAFDSADTGGASSSGAAAPGAGPAPMDEDGAGGAVDASVDAVVELLNAGAVPESPHSDVDELCSYLGSKGSNKAGSDSHSKHGNGGAAPLPSGEGEEADLPLPDKESEALPQDIKPEPILLVATFSLRCELDLKKIAFGLRNAEYNPRKHGNITVRLVEPRATALVRQSGLVNIVGKMTEEAIKLSAKKLARLVQKCGHTEAKFANYHIVSMLCMVKTRFPVRLDQLASKWPRHATYEPEICCSCVFRTRRPKVTYLVTVSGAVMVSGLKSMEANLDAVQRLYPVIRKFRK